jgi:cytochrome c oxidase cbb3-type subunit I/II
MLVGLILAFMFLFPNVTEWNFVFKFWTIRPLHTNAVIFAFVGNAMFAGVYYSMQRLLKARMFSDFLSKLPFLGLAINYCCCCNHFTIGLHNFKRICRVRMANRYCYSFDMGCIWYQYDWNYY